MSVLDNAFQNEDPLQKRCCANCYWFQQIAKTGTCNKPDAEEINLMKAGLRDAVCSGFTNKHIKACCMCQHWVNNANCYIKNTVDDQYNDTLTYHKTIAPICKHTTNTNVIIHNDEYRLVYEQTEPNHPTCENFSDRFE